MIVDIKRTVLQVGMSMPQLADAMGITRQTLHFYEKQGNKVNVATLEKIANILGCKVVDFFYTDKEEQKTIQKPVLNAVCPYCGKNVIISKITLNKGE